MPSTSLRPVTDPEKQQERRSTRLVPADQAEVQSTPSVTSVAPPTSVPPPPPQSSAALSTRLVPADDSEPGVVDRLKNAVSAFAGGVAQLPGRFFEDIGIQAEKIENVLGLDSSKKEVGDYATYQFGKWLQGKAAEMFPTDPRLQGDFLSQTLPQVLGTSAAMVAGSIATRRPFTFSAMSGSSISAAQSYEEAKKKGASEDEAFNRFLLGHGIGLSEAVPVGRLINRLDKGTGGVLKRAAVEAAKEGSEEAVQEFLQTVMDNAADIAALGEDKSVLEGVLPAAGTGASAGAIIGFATNALLGRRNRGTPRAEEGQAATPATPPPAQGQAPVEAGTELPTPAAAEAPLQEGEVSAVPPQGPAPPAARNVTEMSVEQPREGGSPVTTRPEYVDQNLVSDFEKILGATASEENAGDVLAAFGMNKEAANTLRRSIGLSDIAPEAKRPWAVAFARAVQSGRYRNAESTAANVIATSRPVTDEEYAEIAIRTLEVSHLYQDALLEMDVARSEGNLQGTWIAEQRATSLRQALDVLTEADIRHGTAAGRSLSIRRAVIEMSQYELSNVLRRAQATKGAPLSSQESVQLAGATKRVIELDRLATELEQNGSQAQLEAMKKEAQLIANIERASSAKQEDILKDREQIEKDLRSGGFNLYSLAGLDPQQVYRIGRLAVTYIREGATTLDEVVAKMQARNSSLTERDVYEALISTNPKRRARAETETRKTIRRLQTVARLTVDLDDAMNGIFRERKTPVRDSEVKNLQKKIWEIKKEARKDEVATKRLGEYLEKLNALQQFLNAGTDRVGPYTATDVQTAKNLISDMKAMWDTQLKLDDIREQILNEKFKEREIKARRTPIPELTKARLELRKAKKEVDGIVEAMKPITIRDFTKIGQSPLKATVSAAKAQIPLVNSLMRAVMATGDISFIALQGLYQSVAHPITGARTAQVGLKAMFNRNEAVKIDDLLNDQNDPMTFARKRYTLEISPLEVGTISDRHDVYQSALLRKMPWWVRMTAGAAVGTTYAPGLGTAIGAGIGLAAPKITGASDRAFISSTNFLRASLFDRFYLAHRELHAMDPKDPNNPITAYAQYLNVTTGKGIISPQAARVLGYGFFAPRFSISRYQSPFYIAKALQYRQTRKAVAKDLATFLLSGMSVLWLAQMFGEEEGVEVGTDLRESDFGKIIHKNTRIDIWGGYSAVARNLLRLPVAFSDRQGWTGQDLADEAKDLDYRAFLGDLALYKVSPMISLVGEMTTGKDIVGEEVELEDAVAEKFTMLFLSDFVKAYSEYGGGAAALTTLGATGVRVSTWGDPLDQVLVKRLLKKANYYPQPPDMPDWAEEDEEYKKEMVKEFQDRLAMKILGQRGSLEGNDPESLKEMLQVLRSEAAMEVNLLMGK